MKFQTRKASWLALGLLLLALVPAGFEVVVLAQPKPESSRPAVDTGEAVFEMLGQNKAININNVAYTSDEGRLFDVYFACSSARAEDPLRLFDAKDVEHARSYFHDEKRSAKYFLKFNKYCINARHIAYIESKDNSVIIAFNTRIADAFVTLTLTGADAESFKKKMHVFN